MEDQLRLQEYDHRKTYTIRLILAGMFLILFFLDFYFMMSDVSKSTDGSVWSFAISLRAPALDPIMLFITNLGSWRVIVGISIVLVIMDIAKWRKADLPLAVVFALITLAIYAILKAIIARERPDEAFWLLTEHGYSFPSGHTMNSTFCYGIMAYLIIRSGLTRSVRTALACFLAILIFLIAFSRLYVGVHYFTDVVGGFSLGACLLMLASIAIDEIMLRAKTCAAGTPV